MLRPLFADNEKTAIFARKYTNVGEIAQLVRAHDS